jgi:hypothetical protein
MKIIEKIKNMLKIFKGKGSGAVGDPRGLDVYDTIKCSDTLTIDLFYGHEVARINGVPFSFGAIEKIAKAFADPGNDKIYIPLRHDDYGLVQAMSDVSMEKDVEPDTKVMCCGCKRLVPAVGSYIVHGMCFCSACVTLN